MQEAQQYRSLKRKVFAKHRGTKRECNHSHGTETASQSYAARLTLCTRTAVLRVLTGACAQRRCNVPRGLGGLCAALFGRADAAIGPESSRLSVHVAVVCQTVAPFESVWAFGADLPATNPDLFSEKMRREFSWETFFWAAAMLVRACWRR